MSGVSSSSSESAVFPPWHFDRWRAVDDRVRGGSSTSHLDAVETSSSTAGDESNEKRHRAARFWGHLDISTLGGAGFASQTFLFAPTPLHLTRTKYDGLRLSISADPHAHDESPETFTLVLKNTIRTKPPKEPKLPPQPEPAVLTYEAPFTRPSRSSSKSVDIAWSDFKPHYRGKEVPRDDGRWKPLDTEAIYEISFMCRSAFGKQQGDYGVIIEGLSGLAKKDKDSALATMMPGMTSWSAWLQGWWTWFASWFARSGRLRLDEKV